MRKVIIIFVLLLGFYNCNSQIFNALTAYNATIKYKNGDKISSVLYDITDHELILIKDTKPTYTDTDNLILIPVKFTEEIKTIVIHRKKYSKKEVLISTLIGGSTSSIYHLIRNKDANGLSIGLSFVIGSTTSFLYRGIFYYLSGETFHNSELADGHPNADIRKYCLKWQLNNQKKLKGIK